MDVRELICIVPIKMNHNLVLNFNLIMDCITALSDGCLPTLQTLRVFSKSVSNLQ